MKNVKCVELFSFFQRARQHVLDQLSRPGPNSAAARAAAAAAAAGNQTTGSTYNDYGSRVR